MSRVEVSQSEAVKQLLIDNSIGIEVVDNATNWEIFTNFMGNTPDNALALFDREPIASGADQFGDIKEKLGIQFLIRAKTPDLGHVKARSIRNFVDTIKRQVVTVQATDYLIHVITRVGGILPIGKEQGNDRHLWSINAHVTITTN